MIFHALKSMPARLWALAAAMGLFVCLWLAQGATQSADAPTLSYVLPYDVDPGALAAALKQDEALAKDQPSAEELSVPSSQRLFDQFAWRAFIALNWPADASGNPDPKKNIADPGPRVWESWIDTSRIFKPEGGKPDPWTGAPTASELWRVKAAWRQRTNLADQNLQAFSGPLVDQNGKWVRYQVKVNREEYDYLVANELYNLEGQVEFSKKHEVDFPKGDAAQQKRGAIEIKLAWKELGPGDIPARFFITEAKVKNHDTGKLESRRVGLVGMHIAMRTVSSPTWIWATFEHTDNVSANDLQTGADTDNRQVRARPNFNNPRLPTLIPNILPVKNAVLDPGADVPRAPKPGETPNNWFESQTTTPVQVTRVVPIPRATAEVNAFMQNLLRNTRAANGAGSVFQYYELIGAQWPVHPDAPAFPSGAGSAPESIVHKTPGDVVPVWVANTTMETYFQKGVQPAGPLAQDDRLAPDAPPSDATSVFGTESCVGCHYSAGLAVGFRTDASGQKTPIFGINSNFGRTGNANFSWLLQIEARSREKSKAAPKPMQNRQGPE